MSASPDDMTTPDDDIDLGKIWVTLKESRKFILSWMLGVAIVAAAGSLLMPNIYRAEILLAAVEKSDGKSGIASALGSVGGLAAMAGLPTGEGGDVDQNLAVLQSREFLWHFVQGNKLLPLLFDEQWDADKKGWKNSEAGKQPGQWDVYRLLVKSNRLLVSKDKKTELITVTVEWKDPVLAAKWANGIVLQLNQYLANQAIERSQRNLNYLNEELARTSVQEMRKTLFDLIAAEQKNTMMANAHKEFAFRVLDPAVVPDRKSKPARGLIVLTATLLTGLAAAIYVLSRRRKQ